MNEKNQYPIECCCIKGISILLVETAHGNEVLNEAAEFCIFIP